MKRSFIIFFGLINILSFGQTEDENLKGSVKSIDHKTYLIDVRQQSSLKYHTLKAYDRVSKQPVSLHHYRKNNVWYSKEVYDYTNQLLNSKITYRQGDAINNSLIYEYDTSGKIILEKKLDARDKELYNTKYTYDNANRLISKEQWFAGINVTVIEKFDYNNQNLVSKVVKIDKKGQTATLYKYNNRKQITDKGEYDKAGRLFSNIIYTYNTYGDKTALYKFDPSHELTYFEEYEYIYDETGNWKEKTTYEKGIKTMVEIRQVIYF